MKRLFLIMCIALTAIICTNVVQAQTSNSDVLLTSLVEENIVGTLPSLSTLKASLSDAKTIIIATTDQAVNNEVRNLTLDGKQYVINYINNNSNQELIDIGNSYINNIKLETYKYLSNYLNTGDRKLPDQCSDNRIL